MLQEKFMDYRTLKDSSKIEAKVEGHKRGYKKDTFWFILRGVVSSLDNTYVLGFFSDLLNFS